MAVVKEIAESIKLLGDVVKSTREIVKAVNDGREYLKHYYPDAQGDLSSLLEQMQRAIEGLASVTKVVSGFRFVVAGNAVDWATASRDLARLNDYLIAQRKKASKLRGRTHKLKANCDKVKKLRDKLDARTKKRTWGSMFDLFGTSSKARKRAQELHSIISNFYADDQRMIDVLNDCLTLTEKVLAEVEESLGPPATQNPYYVPKAAQVLGVYAVLFRTPQEELDSLADDLNDAIVAIA
jgi:hypothetical protein